MRKREELAFGVERELAFEDAVAPGGVGEEALHPGVAPLHRTPDLACRIKDRGILRIALRLHAKAAADIVGQHADRGERHLEHALGQQLAHDRDALCRSDQRVFLLRLVPHADAGARLERDRRKARVVEPHALDVGRACEGGIRGGSVSVGPVERDVAGPLLVDRDSAAGGRAQHIGGGRELFEIDRHLLGCIERLRQRLRHDDRNALADIADAVDRERRHRGREHRLAVPAGKDRDRRDRAKAVIAEIAAGEDAEHARHSARLRHIHVADRRMTDGRPHEHPVRLARRVEIVGEAALAGEQRLVLAAQRAVITAKACGCAVHQKSPDEIAVLQNATLAACGRIAGRLDTGEGRR